MLRLVQDTVSYAIHTVRFVIGGCHDGERGRRDDVECQTLRSLGLAVQKALTVPQRHTVDFLRTGEGGNRDNTRGVRAYRPDQKGSPAL